MHTLNVRVTPLGGQEAIKMVGTCCAFRCVNRVGNRPGRRFFRFPVFPESRRQKWIQAVKRVHWNPSIHTRICGSHFVTGMVFVLLLMIRRSVLDCCIILGKPDDRENHVDYVPTLFAFTQPVDQTQKACMQAREQRSLRRKLREVNEPLDDHAFTKRKTTDKSGSRAEEKESSSQESSSTHCNEVENSDQEIDQREVVNTSGGEVDGECEGESDGGIEDDEVLEADKATEAEGEVEVDRELEADGEVESDREVETDGEVGEIESDKEVETDGEVETDSGDEIENSSRQSELVEDPAWQSDEELQHCSWQYDRETDVELVNSEVQCGGCQGNGNAEQQFRLNFLPHCLSTRHVPSVQVPVVSLVSHKCMG